MNIFIFTLNLIFPPSSNAQESNIFSWNLSPFCPHSNSNISRNNFLFRKAGYIVKLFNFFIHSENICLEFFKFRRVEYIFKVLNSLQYHRKILILHCFEFLSVEYKLRSFNANKFVSHEMK